MLERQGLGHHLADDDVEIGEQGDGYHTADHMRGDPLSDCRTPGVQSRRDPFGDVVFPVHAKPKTGDGDPDLGRRDVAILPPRVIQYPFDTTGEAVTARSEMVDGRSGRTDNGELRRDKHSVGQDQDRDDAEWNHVLHQCTTALRSFCDGRHAITDATDRCATRSTSKWTSLTITCSPGDGRCPSADVTRPPIVVASVSNSVPSKSAASSIAMSPGSRILPSNSASGPPSAVLNSSPTSPRSSASTSSSVMIPAVPPNSSTTSA